MDFPTFDNAIKLMPTRLQYLLNNSDVPTVDQINAASSQLHGEAGNVENKYLVNFNNLIFM